jgi:single-strand DNA-binding protein
MNDLNSCSFIGRLGADPEIRAMPSGECVANLRLAVGWKSKDKEGAEWVPVVAFGKKAELVRDYLKKGSRVYLSGRFKTRKWTDTNNGIERYTTEIHLEQLQFLDSRQSGDQQAQQSEPAAQAGGFDNFDDDIPF